jgi:NAD(P)-dependent dehydrogenase (short-subunit alcohol dehydrogenase family)
MLMDILNRFRLDGKKALVTGAASGIGKATAQALAQAGADVALVDLKSREDESRQIANDMAADRGVKTVVVSADVSDAKSVNEMMDKIVDAFGTIDIAHSNAGVNSPEDHPEMSLEEWNRVIGINLTGSFLVNQAAGRIMIKSGRGGSIINTASMSGMVVNEAFGTSPAGIAYCVSKAGILQLTRFLAVSWVKNKIRVNAISPGYIDTPINAGMPKPVFDYMNSRVPMGRQGDVEELQGIVVYLASDASSYTTGTNIVIDGGYTVW